MWASDRYSLSSRAKRKRSHISKTKTSITISLRNRVSRQCKTPSPASPRLQKVSPSPRFSRKAVVQTCNYTNSFSNNSSNNNKNNSKLIIKIKLVTRISDHIPRHSLKLKHPHYALFMLTRIEPHHPFPTGCVHSP